MKNSLILTLSLLATLTALPVVAKETPSLREIPRLSLRIGASSIIALGVAVYDRLEVSWRLPILDDKLDILLSGSITGKDLSVGGRYFIWQGDTLQPFVSLRAGTSFSYTGTGATLNGPVQNTGTTTLIPQFSLGIGSDWNILKNIGMTAALQVGYPILFSPELTLKLSV